MGEYFPDFCMTDNKKVNRGRTKSLDEKRIAGKIKDSKKYVDESDISNSDICGIINLGNNCYLNSGLQIIASCRELLYELDNINSSQRIIPLIKKAIYSLLNDKIYNPNDFMNYFCSHNSDFIRGSQCCSQNFIRTLIRNMNLDCLSLNCQKIYENNQYHPKGEEKIQYEKFLSANKIFPESKIQSLFSGMIKSYSKGKCKRCKKNIENYSFSYFIDQNLYLDEIDASCNFSYVLNANIGSENELSMDCSCGKENILKEQTKIIKLPEILIFTLERYQGETNNVQIKPDSILYMKKYTDENLITDCTEYELFAINIRYGRTANFGHEICQVKRNGQWYEINDRIGKKIFNTSHHDCSYGLFLGKRTVINHIHYCN